jgi:UDP-GlcNAc:undecaprenyl-phosphate GlcNAc-1-phosphate transferase
MVRRFLERRPLFAPDRGHIHHRLLAVGITHRRAVLILYAVSIVFTASAIAIYLGRSWQVGIALLVTSVIFIGLVRFVGIFSLLHQRKRQHARLRSRDTEALRHALPAVPAEFAKARTERELFEALASLAEEAGLAFVELRRRGDAESTAVFRWTDGNSGRRTLAVMAYPLGPDGLARAEVEFACANDLEEAEMAPETDILLQVVADVVAVNLARLGSELAARKTTAELPSAEATAPADAGGTADHGADAERVAVS